MTAEETYKTISRYVNALGSKEEFIKEFKKDHRYLQGEVFQLALLIISTCASDNYAYDERNEFAHKIAKEIVRTNKKYF